MKKSTKKSTKREVTPKLVCNVTGKSRVTNRKYLAAKAAKKNTTVEEFLAYYISKDAMRQLKADRSVEEIRADYPDAPTNELSVKWLKQALGLNGKNGPSGPHTKKRAPAQKEISPEIENLVASVVTQTEEEPAAV
jgi:hypothetical protein